MNSFELKNCSELTDEDRKELSAWFYIDFWGAWRILFYRDNQWREIRIDIPEEEKDKIKIKGSEIQIDDEIHLQIVKILVQKVLLNPKK